MREARQGLPVSLIVIEELQIGHLETKTINFSEYATIFLLPSITGSKRI